MARKPPTLQIAHDASVERIVVAAVSRIGVLVPPWAVSGLLVIAAAISHAKWGSPPAVSWATMAGTLSTMVLSALTFVVSHHRGLLGRLHSTATTLFAGLWFTIATITGVGAPVTLGMLFFGGATVAVGWNIRAVIRQTPTGEGAHGDPLAFLFDRAKDSFGLGGAKVRTTSADEYRVKAKMALPAGEKTAGDAIKNAPYIESGLKLPPGSVNVAKDEDDASQAHVTVSDPRVMRRPILWPGPSRPGGSIEEPLRVGMWQDFSDVLHRFIGHMLQLMGMIGSGKSIGGAWNYLAEIFSRRDTATFAIDISKADQTLGPCEQGLHRVAYTKAKAVDLIRKMHAEIPKRTQWLSAHGYQKWAKGCGLLYWFLWIEEFSKLWEALDTDDQTKLEEIVKEIRSAGGSVVISLQRSDYTQAPTLLRSQMAKMCFGVADEDDVKFGVTNRQRKAGVTPEDWANNQPGMAYLDAPSIPATHYAMPMRTYAWGNTDAEAQANMRAHAAAFPATAKQDDEFTTRLTASTPTTGAPAAFAMPPAGTATTAAAYDDTDTDTEVRGQDEAADAAGDEHAHAFGELLATAAELVITTQFASAAMLQRKLRIPREQCLRVLEALQRRRIIGPADQGTHPLLVAPQAADAVLQELRTDGDAVSQYLRTEDPSPEITAGPDDPITETELDDQLETPDDDQEYPKLPPEQARQLIHNWIRERAASERPTFTAGGPEFRAVRERTGMKRPWGYKVLKELVSIGVLRIESGTGSTTTYAIDDLDPLDGPGQAAA